jgi:hypothetical protein
VGANDQHGNNFTQFNVAWNNTYSWEEQSLYLVEPTPGPTTITVNTAFQCTGCQWNILVEQIQGINANDGPP